MLATLRVLRTSQWAHFAVLPLAPLARRDVLGLEGAFRAACGVVAAATALGFAYGLNAIGDRRSDASHAKNPLAGMTHVPRKFELAVGAVAALSVAAAMLLGVFGLGCVLASLAAATVYSVGPRAKAYPWLGLVANTLIFVPLLYACGPGSNAGFGATVATFIGLLVQNQLVHELADADEDGIGGDLTTARWLGTRGVRVACVFAAVAAIAASWTLANGAAARGVSALTLVAACSAVLVIREPREARRAHRHISALGGLALHAIGFFA